MAGGMNLAAPGLYKKRPRRAAGGVIKL